MSRVFNWSLRIQEYPNNLNVTQTASTAKRRDAVNVSLVDIDARMAEKQSHYVSVSTIGGNQQGGDVMRGASVNIKGIIFHQKLHLVSIALHGSHMKGSGPPVQAN